MKNVLTPRELAAAIGVSESSLKRWADDGRLPVSRTAGGHRRIWIGDAVRFIRQTRSPLVRPEILGLSDVSTLLNEPVRDNTEADQLLHFLQSGRAPQARGLILSLYMSGESVSAICDGPIQRAMETLGQRWQQHEDGIYIEHRATTICLEALQQLRSLVDTPQTDARAVGGSPEDDPYLLPSIAAATVLRSIGVDATNLGADVPADSLALAAKQLDAAIIWVSASTVESPAAPVDHVCRLLELTEASDVTVIVGGRVAFELALPSHARLMLGKSMAELAAFVKGLLRRKGAEPS